MSFCDAVQIEEIESNNNAKSVFRTTPKVSTINKAKLVLSPYFNKSPTSSNQNSSVDIANPNSPQSVSNSQKVIQNNFKKRIFFLILKFSSPIIYLIYKQNSVF